MSRLSRAYRFLDGFSGYNKVKISVGDQHKTTFVTKWDAYAYWVMPLGSIMFQVLSKNDVSCFQGFP